MEESEASRLSSDRDQERGRDRGRDRGRQGRVLGDGKRHQFESI